VFKVSIEDMERHPEHAANAAGYRNDSWAVKYRVEFDGEVKTFWRWHTPSRDGLGRDELSTTPDQYKLIAEFWDDTFRGLTGFDFRIWYSPA